MDIFKTREALKVGLNAVMLSDGQSLYEILSKEDIHDIANTLTHYIDKGIQFHMTNIQSEILRHIPHGATTDRLLFNDGSAVLPGDTVKHIKHKLFILLYTLFLHGENLDETITELFNLYRSMVIDKLDLEKEVANSWHKGTSYAINDNEFVRIGEDGKLIPTSKTINNFNNLL